MWTGIWNKKYSWAATGPINGTDLGKKFGFHNRIETLQICVPVALFPGTHCRERLLPV